MGETDHDRDDKLTRATQEGIAQGIENGLPLKEAARANGVEFERVFQWIQRGKHQEAGIYSDFFERLVRAKGEYDKQVMNNAFDDTNA